MSSLSPLSWRCVGALLSLLCALAYLQWLHRVRHSTRLLLGSRSRLQVSICMACCSSSSFYSHAYQTYMSDVMLIHTKECWSRPMSVNLYQGVLVSTKGCWLIYTKKCWCVPKSVEFVAMCTCKPPFVIVSLGSWMCGRGRMPSMWRAASASMRWRRSYASTLPTMRSSTARWERRTASSSTPPSLWSLLRTATSLRHR